MASSMTSSFPAPHYAFDRRVDDVRAVKSDINAVILDYLTVEGYPAAAEKFSKEANLKPVEESDAVRLRHQIKTHIHCGAIEMAIEALNEMNPFILDSDPSLHFALLRLQLVELIRICIASPDGDIIPAVTFASTQLAPRAPTDPSFLEDLERTMSLLIFSSDNMGPKLAALLDTDLRKEVAERVNRAILADQSQRREAAIKSLTKLRAWTEQKARETKKDIPAQMPLGLDPDKRVDENGIDPMIT